MKVGKLWIWPILHILQSRLKCYKLCQWTHLLATNSLSSIYRGTGILAPQFGWCKDCILHILCSPSTQFSTFYHRSLISSLYPRIRDFEITFRENFWTVHNSLPAIRTSFHDSRNSIQVWFSTGKWNYTWSSIITGAIILGSKWLKPKSSFTCQHGKLCTSYTKLYMKLYLTTSSP